jgi:hypothetical protein
MWSGFYMPSLNDASDAFPDCISDNVDSAISMRFCKPPPDWSWCPMSCQFGLDWPITSSLSLPIDNNPLIIDQKPDTVPNSSRMGIRLLGNHLYFSWVQWSTKFTHCFWPSQHTSSRERRNICNSSLIGVFEYKRDLQLV